ncbi:MAG: choice-of-anchor J domain-containing protein [Bacteroidota bacterium]
MKKNYLVSLAFALFVSVSLIGQNMVVNGDLESWDDPTTPSNWDHVESISQESTIVHNGTYSARQQSADDTQDFGHEYITGIVAGGTYQLSYYFLDNDANARTRIWSKWLDDSGATIGSTIESDYSADSPDWQLYDEEFIAPVGATQFYLEVRVYKGDMPGGYVYYDDFSFVNDQTIYPEPTNYTTAFTATTDDLNINLTWDESTGDQLPSGYLVLGERLVTKSFDVPVDGVPVANDMDWSDSKVAVNVLYGDGGYVFTGLESNTSYAFTIYPYTNSGSDIDYKTDGTAPESTSTTANISVLNSEGFDAGLGSWTPFNVIGDLGWEWADTYGNPPGCAKMSGYDGAAFDNEDWLISPALNLTEYTDVTFTFEHARNYASNDGLFVKISTDYDGTSDPSTTGTWTDISSSFIWHEGGWDFINAGTLNISGYSSDATYIAFVFTSNTTESATWEVDNISVLGVFGSGINSNNITKLNVYPNPATSSINITSNNDCVIKIMSITGQLMIESQINTGTNSINIEALVSGLYIVETIDNNGLRSVGKLTVE